jgi:hypothetical protein
VRFEPGPAWHLEVDLLLEQDGLFAEQAGYRLDQSVMPDQPVETVMEWAKILDALDDTFFRVK